MYNTSPFRTVEPNRRIKQINRIILEKVRTLLYTARLLKYLQREAVLTAMYLYNRTPYSAIGFKTPLEKKDKNTITYKELSNIKTFRSLIYYKNKDPLDKLDV